MTNTDSSAIGPRTLCMKSCLSFRRNAVPPPSHNYHDEKSGLTGIYLRFVRPMLVVGADRAVRMQLQLPAMAFEYYLITAAG
jgi:hypothetical protein